MVKTEGEGRMIFVRLRGGQGFNDVQNLDISKDFVGFTHSGSAYQVPLSSIEYISVTPEADQV